MNLSVKTGTRLTILERGETNSLTIRSNPSLRISVAKQGVAGPKGDAGQTHNHSQVVASSQWTVNHNLGFRPNVDVLSTGGVKRFPKISHPTVNQTVISFTTERAGSAHFS